MGLGFAPQFTTRVESRNGIASIALSGELDIATVPHLETHLAPFERDGVSTILLDLRELTFLDTSAIHSFVRAKDRAEANGQRLILIGTRPSARRLFELTSTGSLLDGPGSIDVLKRFAERPANQATTTREAGRDRHV